MTAHPIVFSSKCPVCGRYRSIDTEPDRKTITPKMVVISLPCLENPCAFLPMPHWFGEPPRGPFWNDNGDVFR